MNFLGIFLGVHILSGTIAVFAGAVALAVRKGKHNHIRAGRIFVIAMALSSALGAVLGLIKFETHYITFHAGVLGLTLITGGWLTARKPALGRSDLEIGVINGLNFAGLIAAGFYALQMPGSVLHGFHAGDYFFLSFMAGMAFAFDLTLLFRKSFGGKHRTARHLWRMCVGFFIAAGSAFTGPGAKIFPEAIRGSGLLSLPELIIFLLMLFWLFRTFRGK